MTNGARRRLIRFLIACMIVQLLGICYVFFQSYRGRVNIVGANRAACVRSEEDRRVGATGWRTASRLAGKDGNLNEANVYNDVAANLRRRSKIPCKKVIPKASLLP